MLIALLLACTPEAKKFDVVQDDVSQRVTERGIGKLVRRSVIVARPISEGRALCEVMMAALNEARTSPLTDVVLFAYDSQAAYQASGTAWIGRASVDTRTPLRLDVRSKEAGPLPTVEEWRIWAAFWRELNRFPAGGDERAAIIKANPEVDFPCDWDDDDERCLTDAYLSGGYEGWARKTAAAEFHRTPRDIWELGLKVDAATGPGLMSGRQQVESCDEVVD